MMVSAHDILSASILIVDDQQANVSLLEQLLSEAGYTCRCLDDESIERSARCIVKIATT